VAAAEEHRSADFGRIERLRRRLDELVLTKRACTFFAYAPAASRPSAKTTHSDNTNVFLIVSFPIVAEKETEYAETIELSHLLLRLKEASRTGQRLVNADERPFTA
jgi:hypothetical protein